MLHNSPRQVGRRQLCVETLESRILFVVSVAPPFPPEAGSDVFVGVGRVKGAITLPEAAFCTATLLPTGRHALTAAHCLGPTTPPGGNYSVEFRRPGQAFFDTFSFTFDNSATDDFTPHPRWNGVFRNGYDVAIIDLTPSCMGCASHLDDISRYEISREVNNSDFSDFQVVGFGLAGWGASNMDTLDIPAKKRVGLNRFETTANVLNGVHTGGIDLPPDLYPNVANMLVYDFDGVDPGMPNVSHDTLGVYLAGGFVDQMGTGSQEVGLRKGDSGGPSFVNNRIAGITSHQVDYPFNTEYDPSHDGTFGAVGVATRVSYGLIRDWIDAMLSPRVAAVTIGTTANTHNDYPMPSGYNSAGQPNADGSPCGTSSTNSCVVTALGLVN